MILIYYKFVIFISLPIGSTKDSALADFFRVILRTSNPMMSCVLLLRLLLQSDGYDHLRIVISDSCHAPASFYHPPLSSSSELQWWTRLLEEPISGETWKEDLEGGKASFVARAVGRYLKISSVDSTVIGVVFEAQVEVPVRTPRFLLRILVEYTNRGAIVLRWSVQSSLLVSASRFWSVPADLESCNGDSYAKCLRETIV
ncbi:hypothetical protein MUK42_33729 [Musa troglodytarum]|uniref:Uncharacterized protein n=1 Tax=Musa troglodytarum TaxID=320322 RepID=A0A9E7EAR7_9LILI|nr:hypothetical protein MUK42_33729 [Musa troglodytarum]